MLRRTVSRLAKQCSSSVGDLSKLQPKMAVWDYTISQHMIKDYLCSSRTLTSSSIAASEDKKSTIHVTFKDEKDGSVVTVEAPLGENLLEVAHSNEIDLEGACEGSLACSTCHVIVEDQAYYDKIPEPDDDENDMLDLAFGLTDTSRLGCQVIATEELDGMHVTIPSATRNFAVDGFVPKPH
eukprot:jgi/Picre1/29906/NNA_005287.t1